MESVTTLRGSSGKVCYVASVHDCICIKEDMKTRTALPALVLTATDNWSCYRAPNSRPNWVFYSGKRRIQTSARKAVPTVASITSTRKAAGSVFARSVSVTTSSVRLALVNVGTCCLHTEYASYLCYILEEVWQMQFWRWQLGIFEKCFVTTIERWLWGSL